jgi:biopolymer transport protein ExbD
LDRVFGEKNTVIEGFGRKSNRRHVREIPLAPVLDLLTVVVFFLILSTSFTELTKQTLPPSAISTITDPNALPPLNPKLFAVHTSNGYRLLLQWSGQNPGQSENMVAPIAEEEKLAASLQAQANQLIKEFKKKFGTESSIQISLGPNMTYQEMVSIMDGVREEMQDIVLLSSSEALAAQTRNQVGVE